MYETPQGLYGTIWHPLGEGGFYDFLLTETLKVITTEDNEPLIVEQSEADLWTII
jgi:hypothetical protein